MMDYTIWRYILLIFVWFRVSVSQEAIYCKGTNWEDTEVDKYEAEARYRDMRQRFTNCTHVKGNVEITWQQNTSLSFSFLEDIREVSGYVLVTKSYLPYIPLPNLTVIRGESLFKDNALYVSYNYNENRTVTNEQQNIGILQLQLVSLQEILNGGVLIFKNHELCYASTIDWYDILANGTVPEVTYPFIRCNDCHASCNGRCWGAGPDMCQILNKVVCHSSCGNRCFGPGADECCDSNCAGGCTASGPDNCLACRNILNEGKCVETCPEGLVIEEGNCVSECQAGWTAKDGVCVNCGTSCPITCKGIDTLGYEYVNDRNIDSFKHCTVVENNIVISQKTLKGDFFHGIEELKLHELYALKDVEVIQGYLKVIDIEALSPKSKGLQNLSFLGNLKEVWGNSLDSGASISITSTKSLETLMLRSLEQVKNGNVVIKDNENLCLVNEAKWNSGIFDNQQNQHIDISNNRNNGVCDNLGYRCDDECLGGCWGVGNNYCFLCQNYQIDGSCVPACNATKGEYVADEENYLCAHCDPQCDGDCTGPEPSDCVACKNVLDSGKCKEACPAHKYQTTSHECLDCHENCVLGCTGPLSLKSTGGCDDCYVIELDINDNNPKCLPREDPCNNGYYEVPGVAGARLCRECHSLCATCNGTSDNCLTCKLYDADDKCVASCGVDYFKNSKAGRCMPCHEQCNGGCLGPTASDCKACATAQIDFSGGKFECVRTCPENLKDATCEDGSGSSVVGIVVGLVTAVLAIVGMLIVVLYCYFRRKKESKEYYDLPAAVEVPLHDAKFNRVTARASGRAPNKAKLTIIKQTEIIKGAELGAGAFGTVYSGFWVPENKRFRIPVAIKVLQDLSPSSSDELLAESGVMATVEHRCVLRLLAVCMSEPMMMVTQLMPLGALLDYVRKNHNQIGAYHLLNWSMQIAEGMEYLESKHLIHRDLAARNVLVQSPNQVKITDFGLAKFLDVDEQKFLAEGGKVAVKWLAPESLKYALFTHESDVWSFGVTIWELMTFGTRPYEGYRARDVLDLIDKGERLKQPPICTIDVYMLLLKCWVIDPAARPRFSYLVEEFGKMAQDPQRFVVIENDDEKQLPVFNREEFYSDFFCDDKDTVEGGEHKNMMNLIDADDYLTPMEISTDGILPPGEAEYVNEEPVNHYQDLIKAKMEESEDELESGIHRSDRMNEDAPPAPLNPVNIGEYIGLSEVTGDSMAIGPHIDNPEYHSLAVLQPSPTLQSKNPWDRKPTGPKEYKKAHKTPQKKGAQSERYEETDFLSDDPLLMTRPRAISNVYVDDQMQVMSKPEETRLMNGRTESSV
ncbi:receptor tyrosine-protein kinase erbB-4-like [Anneissia japonica]|uniref:receptor tyrosine-protein kinase erbB-4-like n=1 Tax=Anneissia japonica TaxID=1529436 RepID=UPI00142589A8|nr:receptor tyrosine-protein kinase erbB-4-like [Anneissia japonica]